MYGIDVLKENLPNSWVAENIKKKGEPGEELAVDDASVWKRILDYRVVDYAKPVNILETHSGLGVASSLYHMASPNSNIISCKHFQTDIPNNMKFDYIDIDPFGQPYEALEYATKVATPECVWAITNGEILQVSRNLKGVKLPSEYKGKDCWKWVENIYLPHLEKTCNSKVQFYYIFPTSVRVILSNKILPKDLWRGAPKYMSWISKYANSQEQQQLF